MLLGLNHTNSREFLIYLCKNVNYQSLTKRGDLFKLFFLDLWAKGKGVQGVQTAVVLHGPVVKGMVSYLKCSELIGWGYDR
jgi:hypothetical protein